MCFSTSASFGAGIILTVIGGASIKKATTPKQQFFATIPIIFGAQQFIEGFLWLSLLNPVFAILQTQMTYIFLFIAQVIWPTWVPISVLKMGAQGSRRKGLQFLVGVGGLVSIYLAYCLFTFHVEAQILGNHISYIQNYPSVFGKYCGLLYIVATISPPFLSKIKHMWMLGITILISYIMTTIYYTDYVVSVWCFFASIISIAVFFIIREHRIAVRINSDHQLSKITNPVID